MQGLLQRLLVIPARTEDNLGIEGNPGGSDPLQTRQDLAGLGIFHHPDPQLRVCRMDRNIHGRKAIGDQAIQFLVRDIGQGHIVAGQKGQAQIIIFEIQGLAQTLRQLVDETEDAFVVAMGAFVEQSLLELQPQILILVLFDFIVDHRAIGMFDPQRERFGKLAQAIIKDIAHRLPIDVDQAVTGCNFQLRSDTAHLAAFDQLALLPGHACPLP